MEILLILVFSLHLACVNVAAAGPLLCAVLDAGEGRGSRLAGDAGRWLAKWSLWLSLAGAMLGLVLGSLLWGRVYHEAVEQLWYKISIGVAEWLTSLVLVAVVVVWWNRRPTCRWWERGLRIGVLLFASTNLLYHFPVLFAMLEDVATSESASEEPMSNAEFRSRLVEGRIVALALHFGLAAIAASGVMLIVRALSLERANAREDGARVARWGAFVALAVTLAQVPIGMWLALSLSTLEQGNLMGGDTITSILFIASLALAIALLQSLASIAVGETERGRLVRAVVLFGLVIVLMSGVLQRLRRERMEAIQGSGISGEDGRGEERIPAGKMEG